MRSTNLHLQYNTKNILIGLGHWHKRTLYNPAPFNASFFYILFKRCIAYLPAFSYAPSRATQMVGCEDGTDQTLCGTGQGVMPTLLLKHSRLQLRWSRGSLLFVSKVYFNFYGQEVYQEDKIKEWDPVDPSDLEHFLIIISGKEGKTWLYTWQLTILLNIISSC